MLVWLSIPIYILSEDLEACPYCSEWEDVGWGLPIIVPYSGGLDFVLTMGYAVVCFNGTHHRYFPEGGGDV